MICEFFFSRRFPLFTGAVCSTGSDSLYMYVYYYFPARWRGFDSLARARRPISRVLGAARGRGHNRQELGSLGGRLCVFPGGAFFFGVVRWTRYKQNGVFGQSLIFFFLSQVPGSSYTLGQPAFLGGLGMTEGGERATHEQAVCIFDASVGYGKYSKSPTFVFVFDFYEGTGGAAAEQHGFGQASLRD